jgi:uncharacterized membrane protein YbaN (DUF454 family)
MTRKNFIKELKRQIRQNKIANSIVMAVGIMFLVLAVLGAFLPFVPGILFLIIGIIILGEEFFLTRWIIKKSPKKVQEHLMKRKEKKNNKTKKS